VIASHYAEPVMRKVSTPAELRESSGKDGAEIRVLGVGEPFAMLDDSVGWAWGYAGSDGRVGYVRSSALTPA
jgi:hypothetical protein